MVTLQGAAIENGDGYAFPFSARRDDSDLRMLFCAHAQDANKVCNVECLLQKVDAQSKKSLDCSRQ